MNYEEAIASAELALTPQLKLVIKIYEILPHKKSCASRDCMKIPCENSSHYVPIRLADLLLAIGKSLKNSDVINCHIGIGDYFTFRTMYNLFIYDLTEDNILEQSDYFCTWAYELLTNEE